MHKARRAGVIGWPVSHSLSPRLHNYWLKRYAINGSYDAHAVAPDELQSFLRRLASEGFAGINLTLPHKERALELVDDIDAQAKRIGAVNTVVVREGRSMGYNSDAYGFIQNLKASGVALAGRQCLVIGAGGAARAVCAGLLGEGCAITITNRTRRKAEQLAQALSGGVTVIGWSDYEGAMENAALLVNATSLGMQGQAPLEIKLDALPAGAVVSDLVYAPLKTPLLNAAKAKGHTVVDGLGMLLYQAQFGFKAWFGVKPEVTPELRAYMLEAVP